MVNMGRYNILQKDNLKTGYLRLLFYVITTILNGTQQRFGKSGGSVLRRTIFRINEVRFFV